MFVDALKKDGPLIPVELHLHILVRLWLAQVFGELEPELLLADLLGFCRIQAATVVHRLVLVVFDYAKVNRQLVDVGIL